jgi:hypothetical protein
MAVSYVRVNPVVEMFSPVIRPTGNLAIIGAASAGTADAPVQLTSPSDAEAQFGAPTGSDLTRAAQLAFRQTPGPSQCSTVAAELGSLMLRLARVCSWLAGTHRAVPVAGPRSDHEARPIACRPFSGMACTAGRVRIRRGMVLAWREHAHARDDAPSW